MSLSQAEIRETLTMLEETPKYIQGLVKPAPVAVLKIKPDADTWSMTETLAHLRACADVWGKGIQRMLSEDKPSMRYVSPRGFMKKPKYAFPSFEASFNEFKAGRESLLQSLKALSQEAWQRQVTFTATTRGKHHTVYTYARRIAEHEHHHFSQFDHILQAVQKLS